MSRSDAPKAFFDPALGAAQASDLGVFRRGDESPEGGYVYDSRGRIAFAVNVALVTGRPLLIRGKPGTGKSSLAGDVANRLGWRFYSRTVTSRTRARDLLWSYDAVRRLNDSNSGGAADPLAYVTPGVLWWAFSPATAAVRGLIHETLTARGVPLVEDPSPRQGVRAVVLLDEIDKADPDLPNDLLTPLGSLQFVVTELEGGAPIRAENPPLVVITTNEERDLPQAFLRRCIVLALPDPTRERMLEVARAHFGSRASDEQLEQVHAAYEGIRGNRTAESHEPSLAEFLDAVAAVVAMRAEPGGNEHWERIVEFTLTKPAAE